MHEVVGMQVLTEVAQLFAISLSAVVAILAAVLVAFMVHDSNAKNRRDAVALDSRFRKSLLSRVLGGVGVGPDRYLAFASKDALHRQITACESCVLQEECTECLSAGRSPPKRCPNFRVIAPYLVDRGLVQ